MQDMLGFHCIAGEGILDHGVERERSDDTLHDILERLEGGAIDRQGSLKELQDLVRRDPLLIDGHAHVGLTYLKTNQVKLALDAYLGGLRIGQAVIPPGFAGSIRWARLENRPLLRCMHGAVLSYFRLGRHQEALELASRLHAWNATDEQGIRFLIGPIHHRLGSDDEAERWIAARAHEHTALHYELALLRFRQDRKVEAATCLRRGLVGNAFVAAMLLGDFDLTILPEWNDVTSAARPGEAYQYLVNCRGLWLTTPDALDFLGHVFAHPGTVAERENVLRLRRLARAEDDPQRRDLLLDELDGLQHLDDDLSREIVERSWSP